IGPPESPRPFPGIQLSPMTIHRTMLAGGQLPDDTFSITNIGAGTLSWEVSEQSDWLSAAPTTGSSAGEADTVTLSYQVASLPPGIHTATVTVTAPDAFNAPQQLYVTVTVEGPSIVLDPPA